MKIIENDLMLDQFRFPKSRKKRIRMKWAKRNENWRPSRKFLMFRGQLICHPVMAALLRKNLPR